MKFLVLMIVSSLAYADMDCPKPKVIAEEFLRAQTEGLKLHQKYATCLKPENYKFINVTVPRTEMQEGPECLLEENDSVKVVSVKQIDVIRYTAEYEVKMKTACDGKKIFKDQFDFVMNSLPAQRSQKSCATMVRRPAHNIVRAPCGQSVTQE